MSIVLKTYICTTNPLKYRLWQKKAKEKTIQFISSELISDIYFRCLMTKDIDAEKVDAVSVVVMALYCEYDGAQTVPTEKTIQN